MLTLNKVLKSQLWMCSVVPLNMYYNKTLIIWNFCVKLHRVSILKRLNIVVYVAFETMFLVKVAIYDNFVGVNGFTQAIYFDGQSACMDQHSSWATFIQQYLYNSSAGYGQVWENKYPFAGLLLPGGSQIQHYTKPNPNDAGTWRRTERERWNYLLK